MTKVFVQLGKTGDIVALLPMLYALHLRGERNKLMVAQEFAGVLSGVSYVEPVIFSGHYYELSLAADHAKAHGEVVVCQVNGPRETVAEFSQRQAGGHATDSFVKEAWRMAGNLPLWREAPPLVFDRRDEAREAELVEAHLPAKKRGKLMLVALGGVSSPFPYASLCLELLRLKYGRYWTILDLADVQARRFYDLLGLYEQAKLLVSTDSAPLHLGAAVPSLPVIALVNDQPTLWHGSAWRPNHAWTCRYSEWPKRAVDMLGAIDSIGNPGCYFTGCNSSGAPAIFHVWNRAEERADNAMSRTVALSSWSHEYEADPRWVSNPIHVGSVGRASSWVFGDTEHHPFLKSALQLAFMRAKTDDTIVLTRSTTCFSEGLGKRVAGGKPKFARRVITTKETAEFSEVADLFSATKEDWQKLLAETPDLVLGRDHYWSSLLMEVFRKHGGEELHDAVHTVKA